METRGVLHLWSFQIVPTFNIRNAYLKGELDFLLNTSQTRLYTLHSIRLDSIETDKRFPDKDV